MTPLALTALILTPAYVILVGLAAMVAGDYLAAIPRRAPGRHRSRAVIDGEIVADTYPIPVGAR